MNKRFFTLMAAVMLAGSPFASEAFAEEYVPVSLQEQQAASIKLANGLKFVIYTGDDAESNKLYATVVAGNVNGTVKISDEVAYDKDETAVFEIRNYSSATKTFELYVGSKKVVNGESSVFYADKDGAVENLSFTAIKVAAFGTNDPTTLVSGAPEFVEISMDYADLNSNLSDNGFKFSFPGVAVQPDVNPFAGQMVAIDAEAVHDVWANAPTTGMYFVKADEAGLKLKAKVNADNLKAATFIVVNPNKNFGITGLVAANGEGYDFTTIKGEKLAKDNSAADGKIAYQNGVFNVVESDYLNAADELDITATLKIAAGTNQNGAEKFVHVGVYSLTAGGLKSYVTTKTTTTSLSKASTGGNTYVAAADVLKSSKEAAIYNIYFQGGDKGKAGSYYGKYLTLKANGDTTAYAPAYIDKSLAQSQWVVSNVEPKGVVTFENVYNGGEVSFKLYKTDNAGVYQSSFAEDFDDDDVEPLGASQIKLIPVTEGSSFLTVTDSQLSRKVGIVFGGTGAVTVSKIYPSIVEVYNQNNNTDTPDYYEVAATSKANDADEWMLAKATEIEHVLGFKYLDGSTVKGGESKCKVQTYYLKSTYEDKYAVSSVNSSQLAKATNSSEEATKWGQYAFRKNANGTYTVINYVAPDEADEVTPYETLVDADAFVWSVDNTNPNNPVIKNMDATGENASHYNTVTIDFEQLGESLPAVSRHATFEGIEGGISAAADAKGMIHAIVSSEPLTFWLDTAESKAETPKFYISFGIAGDDEEEVETKAAEEAEVRMFLYTPTDSIWTWDANKAENVENKNYYNAVKDLRAIYRPAALVAVDTIATLQGAKEVLVSKEAKTGVVAGLDRFQFAITKSGEDYVITNHAGNYLYNLNGVLGFTSDKNKAMLVTVGEGDPTANEAIEAASSIEVIGGQGVVTVQGAAGKVITVANILGQTIANQVAASDNVTIAAPAGIVVVSVDGEATKVIVK